MSIDKRSIVMLRLYGGILYLNINRSCWREWDSMKKKAVVSIGCIIILFVIGIIWFWMREVKPLKDIDITELDKVTIAVPDEWIETIQQEDMKAVVDALQAIHIRSAFPTGRDGFSVIITLYYQDGSADKVSFSGGTIIVNDKYYRSEQNYSDDFLKVYRKIEKNPKTIRHES